MDNKVHPLLTLPSSIIIAGAIIAVSIIWTQKPVVQVVKQDETQKVKEVTVTKVSKNDHILGNPNAKIKIVEYSDPSCPFCKTFNPTMEKIMDTYGASGDVAWVYRSFPLNKPRSDGFVLHQNAGLQSEAMECSAGLGGNEKFWAFEKKWYDEFPLQGATNRSVADDTKQLTQIAKDIGLNVVAFNECLTSGTSKDAVEKQYEMGLKDGVTGTPFFALMTIDGKTIAPPADQNGAQSYEFIKAIIDAQLKVTK